MNSDVKVREKQMDDRRVSTSQESWSERGPMNEKPLVWKGQWQN